MEDPSTSDLFDPVEYAGLKERVLGTLFEPAGPFTVDRYTVIEKIGAGGMGVVYAAYDPKLDRRVALKLLNRRQPGGELATRLLREAKALARLAHPNVVTVFDAGEWQGQVFITMEHLAGPTISEWIEKEEPTPTQILEAFVAAGEGLAAAHAAGLIHRDFKPSNVMFAADGRVRVVDFGLVRRGDEGDPPSGFDAMQALDVVITQTGELLGTPAYMAPEQFEGADVGPEADQFAFGVSLYEALAGRRPFEGDTVAQVLASIAAGSIPSFDANLPNGAGKAILRSLQSEPADRYPSMEALLADLRSALGPGSRARGRLTGALVVAGVLSAGAAYVAGRSAEDNAESVSTFSAVYADQQHRNARDADTTALVRARELVVEDPTEAIELLDGIDSPDYAVEVASLRSRAVALGAATAVQGEEINNVEGTGPLAAAPGVWVLGKELGAQRVWNTETLEPIFLDWGAVRTTVDGTRVVTCCGHQQEIAWWDPARSKRTKVGPAPSRHSKLEISTNGAFATLVGEQVHRVRIDDGMTTELPLEAASVVSVTPTEDGTAVVVLDKSHRLTWLDLDSNRRRVFTSNASLAHPVVVSDPFVAIIDDTHRLRIWNLDNGSELQIPDPDAVWFVVAPDQSFWAWAAFTEGSRLRRFEPRAGTWTEGAPVGPIERPISGTFSRYGQRAVFTLETGQVVVWDRERNIQWSPRTPRSFAGATFNADATAIVTLDSDRRVRRWPLPWAGDRHIMAHRGPGFEAVLTARGVFTAGADGRVVLWDPNDWERRRDWKFEDNDLSMDATRDGTLVVSHGRHISTLGPAQERFETVLEADQPIRQVGVSPDGAEMTWVTEENLMFKGPLDGSRITPIEHLCPGEGETKMAHWTCDGTPDGPATDVAYSSQGRYRVVSFEGLRYRWDRETGETFAGVGDSVIAGAPDPTGKRDAALFPGRLLWMPEHEEDEDPGQHVHSPDQEPTHISNPGKDSLVYATAENELRAWYPRLDQDYWLSTTLDGVVRIVAGETWTAVLDDDGGLTVFELPKDFL